MRIVFNIEVGIDVPSYVQGGEILDQITRHLSEVIGPKGEYDVRNFQTHHTPIKHYSGPPMEARTVNTGEGKDY